MRDHTPVHQTPMIGRRTLVFPQPELSRLGHPAFEAVGAAAGPRLALIGGVHGCEYSSIAAVTRFMRSLDVSALSGRITAVPVVNLSTFRTRTAFVTPEDGRNLNRCFPGDPGDTYSGVLAHAIFEEVLRPADVVVDLHGGDLDENLRPYSYWSKTGNEKMDSITRDMVLAFGLDHIIVVTDRPKDPAASRYLESTASTRGKPAITAEAGYSGTVQPEDVNALIYGCTNVMRYLKMLPGSAVMVEHPVWLGKVDSVLAEVGGTFYPLVQRGTYVEQGMKIGIITDHFGKTISELHAPAAGVELYICGVPSMKKGDTAANIGEVTKTP